MMSDMDASYLLDSEEQKQRDKARRQKRNRTEEAPSRFRERSPIRQPKHNLSRQNSDMSIQEEDIETIVLDDLGYSESISEDEYDNFIPILDQYSTDLTSTERVEQAVEVIGSSYFDVLMDEEQVYDVAQRYYQVVGARLSHIYKLLLPESKDVDFAFKAINQVVQKDMPGVNLIQNFAYQYNSYLIGTSFSINPAWNIAIPAGGSEERVRETAGSDSINDTKIKFFAAKDFKYKKASGADVTISNIVGDKVEARLSRLAPRGESAEVNADQSDLMKNKLVYNNNGNNANEKGWIRGHLLNDNLGGSALKFNLYPITGSANKEHHARVESHVKNLVEAGYIVEYKVEVVPTVPAPHQTETAPGYKSGAAPKANLVCEVKVLSDISTDAASSYHPEGSFSVIITSEYKTKHASTGDVSTLKAFTNKAVKSKDNMVDSKAYMRPWTTRKGLTKPLGLAHKDDKHIRDKDYKDWTDKQKNSKFWTWDQTRIDALKAALKG